MAGGKGVRLGLTVPDYVLANTCAKGPFQSGSLELRVYWGRSGFMAEA